MPGMDTAKAKEDNPMIATEILETTISLDSPELGNAFLNKSRVRMEDAVIRLVSAEDMNAASMAAATSPCRVGERSPVISRGMAYSGDEAG